MIANKSSKKPLLRPEEASRLKTLVGLGTFVFGVGLILNPSRAWANLLLGNFYFIALSLSAVVIIAIQYVASAGWPTVFRRIPEAMAAYLPAGAVIMGVLYFGIRRLYPWADADVVAHDAIIGGKSAFLNVMGVCVRAVLYLALWYFLARKIVKNSRTQDDSGEVGLTHANVKLSILFLLVFAVTFSLAAIDWLLSLEPRWYSTMYPWYVFSGMFVNGIAIQALALVIARRRGFFSEVNKHHLHDLGKYIFAFSIFWAYLWFSQYLLIWYSNIPEETAYYVARVRYPWGPLFWLNLIINLPLPAGLLLTVRRKMNERILIATGIVLLIGHWLDLYLMIMPSAMGSALRLGWIEAGVFVGLGALYILLFDRAFSAASPVPTRDPYLIESVHYHG